MRRISVFPLLLLLALVAFTVVVVNGQATQTCAVTRGIQPCICKDVGTSPFGCQCKYGGITPNNCNTPGAQPITCASQCGNSVINENITAGSGFRITKNTGACLSTTGCDVSDGATNYHACGEETCDTGAAVATFSGGSCCTKGCNTTRLESDFNKWDIVPRQCQTVSDCLSAPGWTVTCEARSAPPFDTWCKYMVQFGTIPSDNRGPIRPRQYCPILPCYETTWNADFCVPNTISNNIALITSNPGSYHFWYSYFDTCSKTTSPCWATPTCDGAKLVATPASVSVTLTPKATQVVSSATCTALVPATTVTNTVAISPGTVGYTSTYVSDNCPGTITQVGTNLQFNNVVGGGSVFCEVTMDVKTECNVHYTSVQSIRIDCCGTGDIVFGPYTPFPICANVPTVVPINTIAVASWVGPPAASLTFQYWSSNCTGINVISNTLRFPTTPRTCTVTLAVNAGCGRTEFITRVFTTHDCCKDGIDDSALGEQCDFGATLTGYVVNGTCCTDSCLDGAASGDNIITGKYCTVDADCARPGAIPPVTGICATVGLLKYCKYQATTYVRPGITCSTPCPPGQCFAQSGCSGNTCTYGTSNNLATLDDTECRDDTKCKHTYTCDLTTFATLFVVPSASVTLHSTTPSRRCNGGTNTINPIVTWSSTSPIFGAPTTANLTFGLVGTCALTPVFANGSPGAGTGVGFTSPWIPGGSSTCNISVLITHDCGSITVYRNVPVTCCGDGVLQSGSGETCDAGVLTNSNSPGSCCSTSCLSTPPVLTSNPWTVPQICDGTNQPNVSLVDFFSLSAIPGYSIVSYTIIASPGCYAPFAVDLVNGIFRLYQTSQTCVLTLRATSNCGNTIDVQRTLVVEDCCGDSVFDYEAGETCEDPEQIGYVHNGTCCTSGCKVNASDPASIMYPQLCDDPGDCLYPPSGMGPVEITCPDGWCVFKPVTYQPSGGGCTHYSECPVVSCWDRFCNSSGFCHYTNFDNLFVMELYKCYTGDVCQSDTYCTGDGALAYNDVTFSLPVVSSQPTRLTTFPHVIDLAAVVGVITSNENSFGGPPAYFYTVLATNACGFPNIPVSGEEPTLTFIGQYVGSGTVNCAFNITVLNPCDNTTDSRIYTFLASSCGDGAVQAGQGETCDIGALNGNSAHCCSSTCTFTPGNICSPSSNTCMNNAVCGPSSSTCPVNPFTTAGTPCFTAPGGSQCSVSRTCTGVSYACPNPYFANGTACHNNSNWCSTDTCNGASSECFLGPEIVYDDGLFCNGNETCNPATGLMVAGTPVDCDDGDSCFTDACNEGLDACTHTPVPNSVGQCGDTDVGACEYGVYVCDGSGPSPDISCQNTTEPDIEICFPPGIDENCNGLIDEICTEQVCVDDSDCANITVAACQNVTCNTTINQCYVVSFPQGTPCDDNVNCTENDECKFDYTCAGDPIVCPDGGNTCLFAYCEETTGMCAENVTAYEGNPCACTPNTCTINCACDNNATCDSGVPKTCPSTPDQCTDSVCNTTDDLCHEYNTVDPCSDGLACTVNDTCDSGECVGVPIDCTTPQSCLMDSCDEPFGTCSSMLIAGNCLINGTCYTDTTTNPDDPCQICNATHNPSDWTFTSLEGVACDDGNPCTVDDVCYPVIEQCFGGPKNCTGVPIDPQCQAMDCDTGTGNCFVVNLNGASCDTGVPRGPCALGSTDICGGGSCARQFNVGAICHASIDPQCDTVGICGAADACPPTGSADGTPCTDTLYCFDSTCQSKMCMATIPRDCAVFNTECANYTCDEANDICALVPINEGMNCDIGNNGTCFDESVCDDMGQCVPVPLPDTTPCPPPNACIIDTHCTGVDITCTTGSPVDCSHLSTQCGVGVCDIDGDCVYQPFADGTTCNGDADPCTIHDACFSGNCIAGPLMSCVYLDNFCEVGTCIPISSTASACTPFPSGANCTDTQCGGGCTLVPGYWQSHHSEVRGGGNRRVAWPFKSQSKGLCGKTWLEWMRTPIKNYAWRKLFVHWVSAKLSNFIGACIPRDTNATLSDATLLLAQCDLELRINTFGSAQYLTLAAEIEAYTTGIYGPGQCTDSVAYDCSGQPSSCSPSIHRQVIHTSRLKNMNNGEAIIEPFDESYPLAAMLTSMVSEDDCVNGDWNPFSAQCVCSFGWAGPDCNGCAVPEDISFTYLCVPAISHASQYVLKAVPDHEVNAHMIPKKASAFAHVDSSVVYPGTNGYDCTCNKIAHASRDVEEEQPHLSMLEIYQANYDQCELLLETHATTTVISHSSPSLSSSDNTKNARSNTPHPTLNIDDIQTKGVISDDPEKDSGALIGITLATVVGIILVFVVLIWISTNCGRQRARRGVDSKGPSWRINRRT